MLTLLNIALYYFTIIFISILLIKLSNNGYLGLSLKDKTQSNNWLDSLLVFFMISFLLILMLDLIYYIFVNIIFLDTNKIVLNMASNSSNVPVTNTQDPVRWWPSGTTQSWGIIAGALAVYKVFPGSPRYKAIAGLTTFGITIPSAVYFHAVENPNGFNRLMYSMVEYKRTGQWPASVPSNPDTDTMTNLVFSKVSEEVGNNSGGSNVNKFLPQNDFSFSDSLDTIIDKMFSQFFQFLKPVEVIGYFDDLIGQQILIFFLLLIITVSIIILFLLYIIINILLHNKEFFVKRFNNRLISFYIKYQVILAKISLFVLPLIILTGLFTILSGLYFLVTHPIPYEELGVDLHTFIGKK